MLQVSSDTPSLGNPLPVLSMSNVHASAQYFENDVMSRPAEWLVPLLYERLLGCLYRASVQIETNDVEGKAGSLGMASSIIGELLASLDREKGGALASSLSGLYSYYALEILNVGRTLDVGVLQRLIGMINELHDAWVLAAEQTAPRRRKQSLFEVSAA